MKESKFIKEIYKIMLIPNVIFIKIVHCWSKKLYLKINKINNSSNL